MMTLQQVAKALGGKISAGQVLAPGPGHSPEDFSLSIKLDHSATDGLIVHSFAGDDPIVCKDYVRKKLGLPPFARAGAKPKRKIVATYDYTDEHGELLFQVVRYEPKNFQQRRPDGNGGWRWQLGDVRRVPYHLPELLEAVACDRPIFIAEGEKDVDALMKLGVTATCNSGGAKKWHDEHSAHFKDADVIILPHNDEPGRNHAADIVRSLTDIAASVRVLNLPGLPEKGDAYDWIESGGSLAELWKLAEGAPEPEAPTAPATALSLNEWLKRDIPPLDLLCGSFIHKLCRVIITGPTGLGKTMLGIALAFACAAGSGFLHWKAGRAARVLIVDGEMPRGLMQERLRAEALRSGLKPENLFVLSKEDFEDMAPLNSEEGQQWMDVRIEELKPDLMLLDNIQALIVGDHTKEESWSPVLPWVRSLTKRHIGQIWFHHTGHNEGHAYGTSTRQWQMGSCILMERVNDAEELTFALKFTKARERTPDNRQDFDDVTIGLVGNQWQITKGGSKTSKVTGAPKIALDLLKRAITDAGERPPACNHIKPDMLAVRLTLWRQYCDQGQIVETDKPDTKLKTFKRAAQKLQELGKIGVWGEWVWPI